MATLNLKATHVVALADLLKVALVRTEDELTRTEYEDDDYTRLMELRCDYQEMLEQLPVEGNKWL